VAALNPSHASTSAWAAISTLYSPPLFGVSSYGISWTGVPPLQPPVPSLWFPVPPTPEMTSLLTSTMRNLIASFESSVAPLGSVTWK